MLARAALSLVLPVALACATGESAPAHPAVDSLTAAPLASPAASAASAAPASPRDDVRQAAGARPVIPAPPPRSPLADSLAGLLVFAPRPQTWFVAAARGKRMVVDVGRIDAGLGRDPKLRAAFEEAAASITPFPAGTRFRLRGPWGASDATVTGFDTWNGRIVATLDVPPKLAALARHTEPLIASALRLAPGDTSHAEPDSATAAATSTMPPAPSPAPPGATPGDSTWLTAGCSHDRLPQPLLDRVDSLRDSIERRVLADARPPSERLERTLRVKSARIPGCFGAGRVMLLVSLRAGDDEFVAERFTIVTDSGVAVPMTRVMDYRFRAHDAVYAMDADGDGIDDLVLRGLLPGAGGLSILKLDPVKRRLTRLATGFAWEMR